MLSASSERKGATPPDENEVAGEREAAAVGALRDLSWRQFGGPQQALDVTLIVVLVLGLEDVEHNGEGFGEAGCDHSLSELGVEGR